jgi:hypothetical protein
MSLLVLLSLDPFDPLDGVANKVASQLVDGLVIGNHVGDHYVTCARSLVGNEVRVPLASQARYAHLLGSSHAVEERLVLSDVVGAGREVKPQRVADFVALWRDEDDTGTCAVGVLGPIKEHGLALQVWEHFLLLGLVPVGEKIHERLRLDGPTGLILDAVGADFDDPLRDSSSHIAIANDVLQRH